MIVKTSEKLNKTEPVEIIDNLYQYCENFRKKLNKTEFVENLPPTYLPYRFLRNLQTFSLSEKMKTFDFFYFVF